ncbi:hypothetical protein CBER1_11677 [Cercospora berteroae]|uniref:Cytochrome P450 n=1 Tax=Cercospora berteroae TaxID=357750 RepID=A0A2S6CGY7_9PEZI|nr:hypothetical protein CBER1_11677 [Cercospora berteroae]
MFRSSMAPHDKVLIESVKTHLNPNLVQGTAIKQLVRETPQAVESAFERPTEWTEAAFSPKILRCVAQMSGVVFLGKAKIDYSAWYKLTSEFVINASRAVVVLREQHPLLRPLIHWFLPECRIIRQQSREARKLIEPAILERLNELSRQDGGEKVNEAMVSIDWFTACVQSNHLRNFDFVSAEFTLAIASIRTVSSHVFAGIIRLAMHPECMARIREEIIAVLKCTAKLDKACLFRMRLLDSFLKESARLNCFPTTLRRMVLEDVRFSDGTLLPKGTYCMVAPPPMKDSACYGPDAAEFDGFRYVKLRENAVAKGSSGEQYQYCSVSNHDTIFGLGVHVCPARFFATFQVKILVAYMLLHYDMKLPRGDMGKPLMRTDGYERSIDHYRNLQFMVRQPEIDWQSLMEK